MNTGKNTSGRGESQSRFAWDFPSFRLKSPVSLDTSQSQTGRSHYLKNKHQIQYFPSNTFQTCTVGYGPASYMWLLTCTLIKIKENLKFRSSVVLAVFQVFPSSMWLGAPVVDSGHTTFPSQQEVLLGSTILDLFKLDSLWAPQTQYVRKWTHQGPFHPNLLLLIWGHRQLGP